MRLVVDANVLFAALLRDGATRWLMLHGNLDLNAPAWLWDEATRNLPMLVRRSGVGPGAVDALLVLLRDRIHTVNDAVVGSLFHQAAGRLRQADLYDAPYVAAAMAIDAALWSNDRRLSELAGVKVVTTADLLGAH